MERQGAGLGAAARAGAAGTLFAAFFLAFPAASQTESSPPSPGGATSPSPGGTASPGQAQPAPGGIGLPGGTQGFGGLGSGVPPTAPDSRSRPGTVGFPFGSVGASPAGEPGEPPRAWRIVPSIAVQQSYNDNLFFTPRNKRDDFITTVTPGIFVAVDTARLQGTLNAAPGFSYYANTSDQNTLTLNGNTQLLGTIVPDFFFIQARGSSFVQPITGNTPQTEDSTGQGNLVQTITFSVSPYVTYRFGGTASVYGGYVYSYVDQSAASGNVGSNQQQNPFLLSQFDSSQYESHQGFVVLRTGEDFGRFAAQASLSGTTYVGDGLYDGAYRNIALIETRYAITRGIAALIEFGYQRERFNTLPVTEVDEPVWAVGVRLTPDPDSLVIAKYGRRDGFDSFYLNGNVAVGVRTQIGATYEERLTTSALAAGDLLSTTTVDALGNPVDAQTGVPVLPSLAVTNLATGVLYRRKTSSASISQVWSRDTVRLGLNYYENVPIGAAIGSRASQLTSESTSLGLTWSHELTPRASLITSGEYGITSTSGRGINTDGTTITLGVTLTQELAPGLAGSLSYRFGWRDDGLTGTGQLTDGTATQNIITAGLRQTF